HISGRLTASGRVANMDGITQVEERRKRGDVLGIGVHVIAAIGLARTAVSAAVVGDDAIAIFEKEEQLGIPVIAAKGPAMVEDNGLAMTHVLVVDLGSVFGDDGCHFCHS